MSPCESLQNNILPVPMEIASTLRELLAEARERIHWLEEIINPPAVIEFEGLSLSLSERVILEALHQLEVPASQENLRNRLDVALDTRGSLKTVEICVCRLRKKLAALDPPISIRTMYGDGYILASESRARLAKRRVELKGKA